MQKFLPLSFRSTACIVILSFHMIWFSFYAISNPAVMFSYAEEIRFQFVANAPLLVDMFFTIRLMLFNLNYPPLSFIATRQLKLQYFIIFSGFLVTYNFLRNRSRMNEIKENGLFKNIQLFGKMLLHRYIRFVDLHYSLNIYEVLLFLAATFHSELLF